MAAAALTFAQVRSRDKVLHGRGPLVVRLVSEDPHNIVGSECVSEWWGRNIIVSQPIKPKRYHACNPMYVYKILGPPEFIDFLVSLGRRERFACEHCIEYLEGVDI